MSRLPLAGPVSAGQAGRRPGTPPFDGGRDRGRRGRWVRC